jgi:hypothetical protein
LCRFDQNLNNIKEDLRARDSDKSSSDRTADKVIEHLALLKQDIDATSSLKEQLGELKIKSTTLEEKCFAKDAEISSLQGMNKRLCEERDIVVEENRKRDACKTAENEDLRVDLARTRSDLAQAHKDTASNGRQLVLEQEKLLQAKDSLRIAEDGLTRLEKENAHLRETVSSSCFASTQQPLLIICRTDVRRKTISDCKSNPSESSWIKRQETTTLFARPIPDANWQRIG